MQEEGCCPFYRLRGGRGRFGEIAGDTLDGVASAARALPMGLPSERVRYTFVRICSVGYNGTRGIFDGRTKLTEVPDTGVDAVPNLTGVFGRVLRPYRTFPRTPVGCLPSNYPHYVLGGDRLFGWGAGFGQSAVRDAWPRWKVVNLNRTLNLVPLHKIPFCLLV